MRQSCGRVGARCSIFFQAKPFKFGSHQLQEKGDIFFCYSKISHGISDSEVLWFLGGGVGWLNEQAVFRVKLRKSSA
jgi:hypothetical protein